MPLEQTQNIGGGLLNSPSLFAPVGGPAPINVLVTETSSASRWGRFFVGRNFAQTIFGQTFASLSGTQFGTFISQTSWLTWGSFPTGTAMNNTHVAFFENFAGDPPDGGSKNLGCPGLAFSISALNIGYNFPAFVNGTKSASFTIIILTSSVPGVFNCADPVFLVQPFTFTFTKNQ